MNQILSTSLTLLKVSIPVEFSSLDSASCAGVFILQFNIE